MQAKKSIAILVSVLIIVGLTLSMVPAVETNAASFWGDGDAGDRAGQAYQGSPWVYDINHDEVIDKSEAIAAIIDYFNFLIPKDLIVEVIILYFGGGN